MDQITLNRIQLLHPAVRQEALDAYIYINNKLLGKGIRLRFTHTLRSHKEQETLYAIGRTQLFNTKGKTLAKVTNARAGQSIHNYGLAFDIVLLLDKNNDGIFETASWDSKSDNDKDGTADWMEVVNHFKKLGWAWGGHWKSLPDYPHLEKTFGHTAKSLQAKYAKGDVFTEVRQGITYTWVNL
jgi:peptidoglycan L-alanyl-D-glutamate endopeptidase CwlK